MAVYVLLSFEDDEHAKEYVKAQLLDMTEIWHHDNVNLDPTPITAEVIGVFKKPTMFCNPQDGHRGKKTESGWTKGDRYGWWVCGRCGKPTRHAGASQGTTEFGYNLLPDGVTSQPVYRPMGRHSDKEWTFLVPEQETSNG